MATPFTQLHLGSDPSGWFLLLNDTPLPELRAWISARCGRPLLADALLARHPDDPAASPHTSKVARGLPKTATIGDLPQKLTRLIAHAQDLLITAQAPHEALPLITDLAKLRKSSPLALTTAIALPEDDEHGLTGHLMWSRLQLMGVTAVRTMAYHLASGEDADEQPGAVANTRVQWLVEGKPAAGVLDSLCRCSLVTFVDDLGPYETQRLWLVEGPAIALALIARDDHNLPTIQDAAQTADGKRWLHASLGYLTAGLRHTGKSLPDSATYGFEQGPAWLRHQDEVSRILRRLRRADLQWLLIEVHAKLGRPARAAKEANGGVLPDELGMAFDALHNLLRSPQQYEDQKDLRTGAATMTESRDEAAIHRYRMLLQGVVPDEELEARVADVAQIWKRQRDDAPSC
ncbi:hypothetical protein [Baekduia sp. Peel2402]|uniref:hypothetical protein n=1 Tax=Baekduia sp. Peel2402 TaxID=3458296 RepID=UPI00403E3CAB